ncbi:hypothetical protein JCM11251_001890 [Rhodosporidiobolus azoricus]
MLKRISFQKDKEPAFLIPPGRSAAGGSSSPSNRSPRLSPSSAPVQLPQPAPYSPSYPFPHVPPPIAPSSAVRALDRATLHKTLASLSALLIALDELRDTTAARARAEKRVVKATKELAGGFTEKTAGSGGRSEVVFEGLSGGAVLYETLAELDQKAAKGFEKDYEAVNEVVARFFKKTAKDEKAYEDALATLDAQIAKSTAKYQTLSASSTSSRSMHSALDSLTSQHTSYMNHLSNLSRQVQQTKALYAAAFAEKRELIAREVARAVCSMAEKEWKHRVESTRKGGKEIGRVVNGGAWCEVGMEEGGAAAFSADDVLDETAIKSATPQPSLPTNDFSPLPRQAQSGTVQQNTSLRGPKAPSSSSGLTTSTINHPQAPSFSSYDSSSRSGSAHSTRRSAPLIQSAVVEQADSGQSSNHPPSTRRVSFDERDRLAGGTLTPLVQSPPFTHPHSPTSPFLDDLRRPTPRYGSLPPQSQLGDERGEADEFGRVSGGTGAKGLAREDSFVARMTAKYASKNAEGNVSGGGSENGQAGRMTEQSGGTISNQAGHNRTDSRIQQLAKRYSSPPEATYTQPLSPKSSAVPSSLPSASGRRPLPPTHRHSSSLQFPSTVSGTSEISSSYSGLPSSPQPNRPHFGSSSSYQTESNRPLSQPESAARSPRAYERASPLPSHPEPEVFSSNAAGSDDFSAPPFAASCPTISSSPEPSLGGDRHHASSPTYHLPPQPVHFFTSSRSSARPYIGGGNDGETQVGAHTRVCACPDCTAAKYGASSGAGGEGVEREEEERLQRLLRREKEGTLRGLLNKVV